MGILYRRNAVPGLAKALTLHTNMAHSPDGIGAFENNGI